MARTPRVITLARKNHQYSERRARPEKSAYFLVSTVVTASEKLMGVPFESAVRWDERANSRSPRPERVRFPADCRREVPKIVLRPESGARRPQPSCRTTGVGAPDPRLNAACAPPAETPYSPAKPLIETPPEVSVR